MKTPETRAAPVHLPDQQLARGRVAPQQVGRGQLVARGRYLSGNPPLSVMLRSLLTTRFTDKTATFAFAGETREELQALGALVEAGRIVSIVDRVLPMERAAEAHRLVESEERRGAVVIAIDGRP